MGPTLRVTPVLTQDKVLKAERGGLEACLRQRDLWGKPGHT